MMARVRVAIDLPYHLVLPDGEYTVSAEGSSVSLRGVPSPDAPEQMVTRVHSVYEAEEGRELNILEELDVVEEEAFREAQKLLRQTNRLLRWYRQLARQPTVIEVTRAQASPFRFTVEDSGEPWLPDNLVYTSEWPPALRPSMVEGLADALRERLASGAEPDVEALNLLDAEHAKNTGRFREAVLLCWSAIDSSFVRRFESLVGERLSGEWAKARQFLTGIDFGLRHKMTLGLRLVADRSLFDEPDGFWEELSASYNKRNDIIHRGGSADEADARQALKVARRIIELVGSL